MGNIQQPGRLIEEIEKDARNEAGDKVMATMCQYFFKKNKIPPNWRDNAQLRDAVEAYVQLEQENRQTKNDAERIKRAFLLFLIDALVLEEIKIFPLTGVEEHCVIIKNKLSQRMAHIWNSLDESFIDAALRVRCERAMRKAYPELFSAPPSTVPPVAVGEPLIGNMPTVAGGAVTPMPRAVDPMLQEVIAERRRAREASAPPQAVSPVAESAPQNQVSYIRAGVLLVLLGGAGVAGGVIFAQTVLNPETMNNAQVAQPLVRAPIRALDLGFSTSATAGNEENAQGEPPTAIPSDTGVPTFEIFLDAVPGEVVSRQIGSVAAPEFKPQTYYLKLRTGALPRGVVDLESVKCGVPSTCDVDLVAQCKPVNLADQNHLAHFKCTGVNGHKSDFIVGKSGIDMKNTVSWQEVKYPIIK